MIFHQYGVVIPCYNSEATIIQTLTSVLNQSFPPHHVVVVNDGSSDQTAKFVTEFIDKFPNATLISTPNKGLSAARNLGLTHLKDCEFVAFVDSDDIWHESKMELQINFLENHNEVVGVSCDFINFSEDQRVISSTKHLFFGTSQRTILLQAAKIWGSASAVVVRREALTDFNLFDTNLKFAEDLDAWCKIRELGQWGFLPDRLVSIRTSPNSMQGQIRNNPSLYVESYDYILRKWSHKIFPFELFLKRYDALFFTMRVWGYSNWSKQLKAMGKNGSYSRIYPIMETLPKYLQQLFISLFGLSALVYRRTFRFLNWIEAINKSGLRLKK